MCVLFLSGCVSPVDIPTDREVTPPPGSVPLVVLDTQELEMEVPDEPETLRTPYRVQLQEALLDTGHGTEQLRALLWVFTTEKLQGRSLWLDTLEIAIEGLRSGTQVENGAVRALRLVFWEKRAEAVLRRTWSWERGRPFPGNVWLQLSLLRRSVGTPPRWLLSMRLSFTSGQRTLRLRLGVLLGP